MKHPPYAPEAEISVLGAMLMSPEAVDEALSVLGPEDFYRTRNATIYRHLAGLHANGDAVDVVSLSDSLEDAGELGDAGGHEYVAELVDVVPTAANISTHCRIVRGKADLRRLMSACEETVREITEPGEDGPETIIDRAEARLFEATNERDDGGFESSSDFIWPAMEALEEWQNAAGGIVGIPTGFTDLDRRTSGLHDGDLVILAGRPSHGKTALALNIVSHVAGKAGETVGVFSLEMSKEQLVQRLLAAESRIDLHRMRSGRMSTEQHEKLGRVASRLGNLPIYIDDTPGSTVQEMRAKARRLKSRHGLSLLAVDYLQLMDAPGSNRVEQVTHLSRGMKLMAKELGVPVLCLSQLSRAVEHRSPPRPVLADLRDSGSIEQDADAVFMLWRPEQYMTTDEALEKDVHGLGELVVAKQRNGPTGIVKLRWTAEYARFDSLEQRDEPFGNGQRQTTTATS